MFFKKELLFKGMTLITLSVRPLKDVQTESVINLD